VADFVYPPVIAALRGSFMALGLKIDLRGTENVPRSGPLVVASNHVSHLDFIFAGLAARPAKRYVRFMAKKSVFENRVAGPLMRGMHHIPVDREAGTASIREALGALKAGEAVGIFPEATISRSFEPKEFKTGAVRIAKGGKAPIVPVAVWGTQRLWTYDEHSSLKQRGVPITVIAGEPLDSSGDPEVATAELRRRIIEMVHTAQETYPDDGTGQWWQPARLGGTAPLPA
jgi:1-acyl-sn-glycerol-3-phosphate acyltransferase